MSESQITALLERIEALLAARSTPSDVQQAIEDVFETYGQIAQIREVLQHLVEVIRAHDAASRDERAEIKEVLVQLRELARKQVRAQEDLARAVGAGDGAWNGEERRRRKAKA
jgi:hypothetical protein